MDYAAAVLVAVVRRSTIAAMDIFVVPTVTFCLLYVWFAIDHARRRILHFEVTDHPGAAWVVQQLREAFPFDAIPRHLIFDRDSIGRCVGEVVGH